MKQKFQVWPLCEPPLLCIRHWGQQLWCRVTKESPIKPPKNIFLPRESWNCDYHQKSAQSIQNVLIQRSAHLTKRYFSNISDPLSKALYELSLYHLFRVNPSYSYAIQNSEVLRLPTHTPQNPALCFTKAKKTSHFQISLNSVRNCP